MLEAQIYRVWAIVQIEIYLLLRDKFIEMSTEYKLYWQPSKWPDIEPKYQDCGISAIFSFIIYIFYSTTKSFFYIAVQQKTASSFLAHRWYNTKNNGYFIYKTSMESGLNYHK